jgi:hypothetical protein
MQDRRKQTKQGTRKEGSKIKRKRDGIKKDSLVTYKHYQNIRR